MAGFDFAAAQQKISEINKIVETCPESVRAKAFELLFAQVFGTSISSPTKQPAAKPDSGPAPAAVEENTPSPPETLKLPGNVLAFLRRHSLPKEALDQLFMLDQEPHLQIYKIETQVMAKAQLQKVLMILLENAILSGSFKAPYKEMRESCKEAGLLDYNFNKTLKKNSALFKGAITADKINDEEQIELTGDGQTKLAEVIRELSRTA